LFNATQLRKHVMRERTNISACATPNRPARPKYGPIEMPRSRATGLDAFFAMVAGIALICHSSWMAALGVFAETARNRIAVAYGFWIFLLSDIVMFSASFAGYAVFMHATAGAPTGAELFNRASVAIETACLLASSYTCGLMSLAINSRRLVGTYFGGLATFALGTAFLVLEIHELANMIALGAIPERSAFLLAFFALVGCYVLHVGVGLIWLSLMMAQVATQGFHPIVERRLLYFTLFWHALDIIWVGLFTVVYLMGVGS
jgi:cytochrome o ubiquinol oxidase subunit 3